MQIRSANSAGLTFSEEINNQSYIGARVFINTDGLGLPGTQFPRGTPTNPVNNWDDALVIAQNRKFVNYDLNGVLTLTDEDDLSGTHWFSPSPISGILYLTGTTLTGTTVGNLVSGDVPNLSFNGAFVQLIEVKGFIKRRYTVADGREDEIAGFTIEDSKKV